MRVCDRIRMFRMSCDSPVTTNTPAARVSRWQGTLRSASTARLACAAALLATATASCSSGPAAPTISTPASSTTITEIFSSTLAVGGNRSYAFSIAGSGTTTATLTSIGGAGVPDTVIVNLSIGSPGSTGCLPSNTAQVQVSGDAGVTTQVTSTLSNPGVYCVGVSDVGNLFAPATFTVQIDHP